MPYKDKDPQKLYYTIGEVAAMFGVNTSLIRYYENEFDIIKPHKNKKGNRLFTRQDLDHFTAIFELTQSQGMTLAEAKVRMAEAHPGETVREPDVLTRLKRVRKLLQELYNRL